MPDDERLGGTRDPHEYGRRHRREDGATGEDKPRRRRRSMEAGGGLSVADLVQKHTASRSDLTPVDPQQLQQNALVSGRRARQDRQGAEGPAGRGHPGETPRRQAPPPPSIADALNGETADFPRDDAPRPGRRAARNGFPADAAAPGRRPHPGEAARKGRRAAETPNGHHAAPAAPGEGSGPRRTGESSGHHALPAEARRGDAPGRRAGGPDAFFPETPADAPHSRRGEAGAPDAFLPDAPGHHSHRGEAGAPDAFLPDAPGHHSRRGEGGFPADASGGRRGGPAEAPGAPDAFLPDAPSHHSRRGEGGFPAETPGGRRGGPDLPADAPGAFLPDAPNHHSRRSEGGTPGGRRGGPDFPADAPGGPDAFFSESPADGPHSRRDASGFPADTPGGRRAGGPDAFFSETPADAPHSRRGGPGFPVDAPGEGSGPRRRVGESSAFLPNGEPRNGRPGRGDAGFPADAPGGHRAGGPDAFFPDAPADAPHARRGEAGFPADAPGSHSRHDIPADAPGGRRAGGPDAFFPDTPADAPGGRPHTPGDASGGRRGGGPDAFFPDADGPHARRDTPDFPADAPGGRRAGGPDAFFPDAPGEGSGPRSRRGEGFPADVPGESRGARRVGEASAHHPIPGETPPRPRPRPRRARRAGEAAPTGFPAEAPGDPAFPRDDAPLNGRPGETPIPGGRRPGEASAHHPLPGARHPGDPGEPPFPRDDAPRNGRPAGETSAHYPVPGRQGPPTPPPGQWPGEPLSELPAAIDPPPMTTGVPPVPPPLPPRGDDDLVSMTTEMEAIGEEVQKRRTIDHTLARFSAVHDEIKAEEREKKAKRRKLLPWQNDDSEMDRLDEMEAQQSMAMRIPVIPAEDEGEPEDEQPKGKGRKKKRKKWGKGSAGKAFVVFFAALVFVGSAAGWGFKSYVDAAANTVDALDPDSKAIQDADAQLGDENFLLVGSDTRAGAAAEEGVGDENTIQGARSDTVMIAHIPKNRERVVVVSFPRDLEVTRPACEGWDAKTGELNGQQHPAEEQVKINTAYQVGGPKCVTKMVQELSGLAINHFVGIDFHGFKDMVDAVEGVEVCVERPMKDETLGTIVPEAGKNVKLTGDQALNFVRARKVEGDVTSDYGRIIRQQRFLSSLLRKAMSGEVLLDPGKLTDFVDAFSKATFGDNVGVDELFTLGQSMQGVEAGRVTFITVPTVGEANERGNEDLRVEDTNALFEAIRQDAPLPGEAPKKPADDASKTPQQSTLKQDQPQGPVDPKTIKIQVLNGGNETGGIAGDTADALAEHGFQIMRVDPAPENIDKPAIIKHSKDRTAEAQTLQAAVPGSQLVEDPSVGGAVILVIGPGFDGEVVSPNGGGTPVEVPDNLSTVNAGDVSCA